VKRLLAELRGPVAALLALAILARLVMSLAAMAATERAAFDAALRASLCLPSGLPAPDAPDAPAVEPFGHCPLCRLPDADSFVTPPLVLVLALPVWWAIPATTPASPAEAHRPPPRGPPPARAPPRSMTIG